MSSMTAIPAEVDHARTTTMRYRGATVLALALLALSLALAPASRANVPTTLLHGDAVPRGTKLHLPPAGIVPRHGSLLAKSMAATSPLISGGGGESLRYWRGPVQHHPKLYLLWWGGAFEGTNLYTYLHMFYYNLKAENDIPGSTASWQGILSQYWSETPGPYKSAEIAAESHLNNVRAPSKVTTAMLEAKISEWIASGAKPDENAQFVILTAPGTTFASGTLAGGCAWHDTTEEGYGARGEHYSYSLVPYAKDVGCIENIPGGEEEKAIGSTTESAAHEFAESVSDPMTFRAYEYPESDPYNGYIGWRETESDGQTEIGDLCNKLGPFLLGNKSVYVTKLWDDQDENKCRLEDPPYSQPPPPSVTTEGATNVGEASATLNGSVNPNGPDSYYYFQYGPTTTYGLSTTEGGTGFGTAAVHESAPIGHLLPGIVYHYRLVAYSWAGTSYGADQTLVTRPEEASSRWSLRDAVSGNEYVFYRGANHLLDETYYVTQAHGWASTILGGEISAGSGVSAIRDSGTGNMYVFYRGVNGLLDETYYVAQANGWASTVLGGEMASGSTPSAVRDPTSGNMYVFYKGVNGLLDETYYVAQANGWASTVLGGGLASGASPSAFRDEQTGNMYVFYKGTNNLLGETYYVAQANGWASIVLGGEMASGATPSAIRNPTTGNMYVFYKGVNGLLDETYYVAQANGWASTVLGGEMASGADPSSVRDPNTGNMYVFYKGINGLLGETYYVAQANGWASKTLGGEMAMSASPSAVRDQGSENMYVFYKGINGLLGETYYVAQANGWATEVLGGEMG